MPPDPAPEDLDVFRRLLLSTILEKEIHSSRLYDQLVALCRERLDQSAHKGIGIADCIASLGLAAGTMLACIPDEGEISATTLLWDSVTQAERDLREKRKQGG